MMSNYYFKVDNIKRGEGRSITSSMSYISGRTLYDCYNEKTYYCRRNDVLYCEVYQPHNAPAQFKDLQYLCNAIDKAENRYDSRTGREFICSLPNELLLPELIKIVDEYVTEHFVEKGLCAVVAIHEGRNKDDPDKNNPHVHIIVSTRTVGPDGFNKKKDREHNKTDYTRIWRSSWSGVQNRAYERNGLNIRVSHESLEVQGIRRKPLPYLNRIDYQKEERGIRTSAGDRRRAVQEYNRMLVQKRQLKRTRGLEIKLSR